MKYDAVKLKRNAWAVISIIGRWNLIEWYFTFPIISACDLNLSLYFLSDDFPALPVASICNYNIRDSSPKICCCYCCSCCGMDCVSSRYGGGWKDFRACVFVCGVVVEDIVCVLIAFYLAGIWSWIRREKEEVVVSRKVAIIDQGTLSGRYLLSLLPSFVETVSRPPPGKSPPQPPPSPPPLTMNNNAKRNAFLPRHSFPLFIIPATIGHRPRSRPFHFRRFHSTAIFPLTRSKYTFHISMCVCVCVCVCVSIGINSSHEDVLIHTSYTHTNGFDCWLTVEALGVAVTEVSSSFSSSSSSFSSAATILPEEKKNASIVLLFGFILAYFLC